MFEPIKERGGKIVKFDPLEITSAVVRAGKATAEFREERIAFVGTSIHTGYACVEPKMLKGMVPRGRSEW